MLEEIFDVLIQIQECTDDLCPGSAFTVIGAAFATQGYHLQSAIIGLIGKGGYEMWAVWLYMFSFFAFIIMIVLNGLSIPKNVMWFVLGPALFNWMVYTGTDVYGVKWSMATKENGGQSRVWEIAEPGTRNIDPVMAGGELDTTATQTSAATRYTVDQIRVAWLFAYWDGLISATVEQLVGWVGADEMRKGAGSNLSNLGDTDVKREKSDVVNPVMIANSRWGKLQAIVGARITSPDLKDAFVEYMSGTCGDKLRGFISYERLASSRRAEGKKVVTSVFNGPAEDSTAQAAENGSLYKSKNKEAWEGMKNILIPKSRSFRNAFKKKQENDNKSLYSFLENKVKNSEGQDPLDKINNDDIDYIKCEDGLSLLINSLRWETGQVYHKILADWDKDKKGSKVQEILSAFYYGWKIEITDGTRVVDTYLERFTHDLIFSYMVKNELEFIPKITDVQYSTKQEVENASDAHIQSLGSKNKYGELYTWAQMLPYIQGVLMFILAGAYPIVCVIFIIPGCHKVIVTWAAFWAWVKFWDVGFAIVSVVERSLWGMLGNSDISAGVNKALVDGTNYGSGLVAINVTCENGGPLGNCAVPNIENMNGSAELGQTLTFLDRGMAIGGALNYGVNNGYYIYLMAALYMAVPVICGQVILQGKHGVGSLAGMMTGGAEKAAGGAAEASAKSQHAAAITNTLATAERQVKADAATKYAMNAMQAGNKAADAGLLGSKIGAANTGIGLKESMMKNTLAQRKALASGVDNISTMLASGHSVIATAMGLSTISSAVSSIAPEELQKIGKGAVSGTVIGILSANTTGRAGGGAVAASGTSGGTGGTGKGIGDFNAFQSISSMGRIFKHAADMEEYNKVNPFSENVLKGRAENNLSSFEAGANQSMEKAYAERQETMARYEGDMAGYEMKRDMAGSMQHIAGVFGVNLMPQQKPYDIKGMMGAGEVGEYKNKLAGNEKFVFDKEGSRVGSDIFGYFDAGGTFATQISTDMNSLSQFNENGIFVNGFTNPTHNGLSATYGNLTQRSGVGQVDLGSSFLGGFKNGGLTSMDATHTVDLGKGESAVVYGTQDNSQGSTWDTVAKSTPDGNGYAVKNQDGQDSYLAGGSGRAQEIEKKKEKEKQ